MNRPAPEAEGEFAFIQRRLAPLAAGAPGALGLQDDAALIHPQEGETIVIAADMLVAGRHFPLEAPLDLAARKALRANLSDIAAMGARATGYMLSIAWPAGVSAEQRDLLVDGLAADQAAFGLHLLGGDTTTGSGPLVIAITALGAVPDGGAVRRKGAQPGDRLAVTGRIGDATLALDMIEGRFAPDASDARELRARYYTPTPRLEVADAVRAHAHAAIDISDGLIADAGHIAETSRVRLVLELDAVPLSEIARAWVQGEDDPRAALARLCAGGDDYELLLALPETALEAVSAACAQAELPLTVIGSAEAAEGDDAPGTVCLWHGEPFDPETGGFTHF